MPLTIMYEKFSGNYDLKNYIFNENFKKYNISFFFDEICKYIAIKIKIIIIN